MFHLRRSPIWVPKLTRRCHLEPISLVLRLATVTGTEEGHAAVEVAVLAAGQEDMILASFPLPAAGYAAGHAAGHTTGHATGHAAGHATGQENMILASFPLPAAGQ